MHRYICLLIFLSDIVIHVVIALFCVCVCHPFLLLPYGISVAKKEKSG